MSTSQAIRERIAALSAGEPFTPSQQEGAAGYSLLCKKQPQDGVLVAESPPAVPLIRHRWFYQELGEQVAITLVMRAMRDVAAAQGVSEKEMQKDVIALPERNHRGPG